MCVHRACVAIVSAALFTAAAGGPVQGAQPAGPPRGQGRGAEPVQKAAPASIAGTVTRDGDGAAVPRARVILQSPGLPQPRVTITDARGSFAFDGLPAGDYELLVMRTGYALAGGPARAVAVRVARGESRAGITLALQRAGIIPGRVLDEDGTPLAGAVIEALSLRAAEPESRLTSAAVTESDDRGEFRLTGLPAGQYFVVARDAAFERVGDDSGPLRYAPTYFPGVVVPSEALPVAVSAGGESPRAEFRIRIVKPARVSGIMTTPDKRPLLSGAVILVPREAALFFSPPSEDVDIRPDGTFIFRNVLPGTYQLRGRAAVDPKQVMLFGSFAVTVEGGRDIGGIALALSPGAVVQGRVEWLPAAGRPPEPVGGLRVRAPFTDGTSFGDTLTGEVAPDGSFRLRGVMTGPHYFAIDGLPRPWGVSAVLLLGRDRLDDPINLHEGEQVANVRLVVSNSAADLTGTVRDALGRPLADALILVMPPAARAWQGGSPRFRSIRAGHDGRFEVAGLLPGDYRVSAVFAVDELAAQRPQWLQQIDKQATPVSLASAERRTIDLVALHADALPPLVAR